MTRIVIKTYKDADDILNWAISYLKTLPPFEQVEFHPPFTEGDILFEEENARMHFKYLDGGDVILKVYLKKYVGYFCKYKYNYSTMEITDVHYHKKVNRSFAEQYRREKGDTLAKYAILWFSLMLMAVYYRPEVEKTKQEESPKPKRKSGKKHKQRTKDAIHSLCPTTYIIGTAVVKGLPKHHRKPDHEFSVRGHYRHYKSGKVVWIPEHQRCVGKGKERDKIYKVTPPPVSQG